eukprot:553717_1
MAIIFHVFCAMLVFGKSSVIWYEPMNSTFGNSSVDWTLSKTITAPITSAQCAVDEGPCWRLNTNAFISYIFSTINYENITLYYDLKPQSLDTSTNQDDCSISTTVNGINWYIAVKSRANSLRLHWSVPHDELGYDATNRTIFGIKIQQNNKEGDSTDYCYVSRISVHGDIMFTGQPTTVPTTEPTLNPSSVPTLFPSSVPTLNPSVNPSESAIISTTSDNNAGVVGESTSVSIGNSDELGGYTSDNSNSSSTVIIIVLIIIGVIVVLFVIIYGIHIFHKRRKVEKINETNLNTATNTESSNNYKQKQENNELISTSVGEIYNNNENENENETEMIGIVNSGNDDDDIVDSVNVHAVTS